MMLGLFATLQLLQTPEGARSRGKGVLWALLAGCSWGYGALVRPMPGVLFIAAAATIWLRHILSATQRPVWKQHLLRLVVGTVPLTLAATVLLWVNTKQSGDPLRDSYQLAHGQFIWFSHGPGHLSLSFFGALLRQNYWLFGWVLSFVFIPFARGNRRPLTLLWALVAADYAYRLILPKTVVATTGPIYVAEVVPLLALASASGMLRVREVLQKVAAFDGRRWLGAAVAACFITAALMFIPPQLRTVGRAAQAWQLPYAMLAKKNAGRALVFADGMTQPRLKYSWAYFPPNPSPKLNDEVIFVRPPRGGDPAGEAIRFWKSHFAARSAWLYYYHPAAFKPILKPLTRENWPAARR